MTTAAAIADLILVSWNVGYGWSAWHVEVDIGLTRCGARFSIERVNHKVVSSLHGMDVCGTCAKHTPAPTPAIDINAHLNYESIGTLLVQGGMKIITASRVGVIAQCPGGDPGGSRLHRAVLQPNEVEIWRASYAIARPNRRLGQPRIHQIVSRHVLVRDPLELVLWLLSSERAAQKWVG